MAEWIIACNPKEYDIIGAFNARERIDWKQSTNIEADDIVYIYVTKPVQAIQYQCVVVKANMENEEVDDRDYVLEDTDYANYGRYMQLQLLKKYDTPKLCYHELQNNGLKTVQGPSIMPKQLSDYIFASTETLNGKKITRRHVLIKNPAVTAESDEENITIGQCPELELSAVDDDEDKRLIEDLKKASLSYGQDDFRYEDGAKDKPAAVYINGCKTYPRDRQTAINALAHAHYLCEAGPDHPTFIRKNSNKNYTEPHHLVPMSFSDEFLASLDREQNIVSLCSNCHNLIHYGKDAGKLLKILYQNRKEALKGIGINITYGQLLDMYQLKPEDAGHFS